MWLSLGILKKIGEVAILKAGIPAATSFPVPVASPGVAAQAGT